MIEIEKTAVGPVHHPGAKVVFKTSCYVKGDLDAGEVVALKSLKVKGSVNVARSLTVIGGLLAVGGDLISNIGNIRCNGMLQVGGRIISGHGYIRAASIEAGDVKTIGTGGNIFTMLSMSSKENIVSGGAIVAGLSIKAGNLVKTGEGYKIFAGVMVENKEKNIPLTEIEARVILGEIGHGTPKIIKSS